MCVTSVIKINNGESVFDFTLSLSTQSNAVIYATNNTIFSAPVSGGVSTELGSGSNFASITELTLVDNDQAVVYVPRDADTNQWDLYLTKLDASATINLSAMASSYGGLVKRFRRATFMLDPSGENVVYRARSAQQSDVAIYTVKLDGTGHTKVTPDRLHANPSSGEMAGFYRNKFYFIYDKESRWFTELYSFDFSNNATANISSSWPEFVSEDAVGHSLLQNATGSTQAFLTKAASFSSYAIQVVTANTTCRIVMPENAPIVNGAANMVMESSGDNFYYTLIDAGDFQFYKASTSTCSAITIGENRPKRMALSPDELHLVYTTNDGDLFAAAGDGSSTPLINSERPFGGVKDINGGAFAISPDSSRIIYWADQDTEGVYELYSVTMDGLTTDKINASLVEGGQVFSVASKFSPEISADNNWVVYRAQQDSEEYQLYKSRLDGSDNTLLSGDLGNSTLLRDQSYKMSEVTNDSSTVVYLTHDNADRNAFGLYATNLEGAPVSTQLTPTFQQGGRVASWLSFSLTSDSLSVIYLSRESAEAPYELFASKLDGSDRVKLSQAIAMGRDVRNYSVTADDSYVVYLANTDNIGAAGLYVSDLDGTAKRQLQESVVWESNVKPRLSNDGKVVFRAVIQGVDGIYFQPLTGGEATLIFEVPEGRQVRDMILTNDNKINIFGDFRQFGVNEKFSFDI